MSAQSHVTPMNESCHKSELNVPMVRVPHVDTSCHTYEWFMSQIWSERASGACVGTATAYVACAQSSSQVCVSLSLSVCVCVWFPLSFSLSFSLSLCLSLSLLFLSLTIGTPFCLVCLYVLIYACMRICITYYRHVYCTPSTMEWLRLVGSLQ